MVDLKAHITKTKIDVEKELSVYDPQKTRKITRQDFSAFLTTKINFQVNAQDLSVFLQQFPLDQHGLIDVTGVIADLPKHVVRSEGELVEDTMLKIKEFLKKENMTAR